MSEVSRDVLSSLGLRPSSMYENRGVNVLVCLFLPFFKYRATVRIGSILSGVNVLVVSR